MKTVSFIAVLVVAWFAYGRMTAPVTYPPGVLIPDDPVQYDAEPSEAPFADGKFQITPLAHFALDARVLHHKVYRYDTGAALVPIDLAVGWGPMSDQKVLDRLEITQSARFFWYHWEDQPPIPPAEIVSHATNLHLIPSTAAIAAQCKALRTGDLIHLSGLLVQATGPKIGTWRSSLTRTDKGNGACELVWVEDVYKLVLDAPP